MESGTTFQTGCGGKRHEVGSPGWLRAALSRWLLRLRASQQSTRDSIRAYPVWDWRGPGRMRFDGGGEAALRESRPAVTPAEAQRVSSCSIEGCTGKSRARGMCTSHYYHLWRKPQAKDRVVLPRRAPHQLKFTPELWWSWWASREPDAKTLALRAGIAQMRTRFVR